MFLFFFLSLLFTKRCLTLFLKQKESNTDGMFLFLFFLFDYALKYRLNKKQLPRLINKKMMIRIFFIF
jgi:hypothetical protein